MGLRDEFEKIRDKAEDIEDEAEALWQRSRGLVVAGIVLLLLAAGFVLGRCSA